AGQFREPWGIGIGSDGTIYVADTWNHRVQHFSTKGDYINSWGEFGTAASFDEQASPGHFYGPRDVAVGTNGLVYVSDTGNHRIQVFSAKGRYIGVIGKQGTLPGDLNEPVGLAFTSNGELLVADTWNGRVDVFGTDHSFVRSWDIVGWYGQLPDNKPYITVDAQDRVYVTDPESYRVLMFQADGTYLAGFGQYGTDTVGMNLPTGLDIDTKGNIFVSDTGNNRIVQFAGFDLDLP
ncbi:MAG: NHL repeat-containing protein, partial [Chloroflexota bacterium]